MKGLMKMCSSGSAMWRGLRAIGFPRVGVCAGSRSVGGPQRKWIDNVKECLRKRGLNVRQARRMVQDTSEWRGFVRGNAWGTAWGINP